LRPRSHIKFLRVYPLSIPLRKAFSHAAHVRQDADPIVIQIELADGTAGHGETLPRPYVSGETPESVVRTIRDEWLEGLVRLRPARFPEAMEWIAGLPTHSTAGDCVTAARAGIELALIDAYCRHFGMPVGEVVGWFGLSGLGSPGSIGRVRYSGILSGDNPASLTRKTRLMWWYGLRDFKLKVGYEDDEQRIRSVAQALGRSLGRTTTLRLDANGGWTLDQAIDRLRAVADVPIACVEQPLAKSRDVDLVVLKQAVKVNVMLDESLVTLEDAQRLHGLGVLDVLNVRISKNGGFLPGLRLAHFARRNNLGCQLGCMVGETSILSAVGRRWLEQVPGASFAEGSYGRFLLSGDIAPRPVGFGLGGRPKPLPGPGWGVEPDPALLEHYARPGVIEFPF